MLGGFEDVVQDVDNVFALVAFAVVRAGAVGNVGDCDVVDISSCASHGDGFGGGQGVVGVTGAVDDEHPVLCCQHVVARGEINDRHVMFQSQ